MSASLSPGEILLAAGMISADQLRIARHEEVLRGIAPGRALVELGFVSEGTLRDTLAAHSGITGIDLAATLPDPDAIARLPATLALRHRLLPLRYDAASQTMVVALADAGDLLALDRLRAELGSSARIELRLAGAGELARALEHHYGETASIEALVHALEQRRGGAAARTDEARLVVRLIDAMLADAAARGASDLHFEPEAGFLRVRYRIDGLLHQMRAIHASCWPELAVRIKVMAGLDIAESRSPQDGRISLVIGARPFDFRVATQPTLHGENIVLRILDRAKGIVPLDDLGLAPAQRSALDRMLARPEGLVLVAGPTGSGKTTTLYSILSALNDEGVNIMTLEDPVEYPLAQVRQTQVGEASRLDFASGVRALLRQDPDVILIGEIRDAETAHMALRAALTGHRVFATVHANSAFSVVSRLVEIGVRPELLAGNLCGILSQRLVRRLCPACRQAYAPDAAECARLGLDAHAGDITLYRASACPACDFRGYRGRRAIIECLPFDAAIDALVARQASALELQQAARARGLGCLAQDGLRHVLDGVTSVRELARVVDLGVLQA